MSKVKIAAILALAVSGCQTGPFGDSKKLLRGPMGALIPNAAPNDGKDDTAAIQRAMDAGGVIELLPGKYDVRGTLFQGSNTQFKGSVDPETGFPNTELLFQIPRGSWGIKLKGNASNSSVENLMLTAGGIAMGDGNKYTNIKILNNDISKMPSTEGIKITIPNEGTVIEDNYIHDANVWGMILWYLNGKVEYNTCYNVHQFGHFLATGNDVSLSHNLGKMLDRAGLEVQTHGTTPPGDGLLVEGNEFYDWDLTNSDAYAISLVPDRKTNVIIRNNYGRASFAPEGAGKFDTSRGTPRWAYCYELGFQGGLVENNVSIGPFKYAAVVSGAGGKHTQAMTLRNNKWFGIFVDWVGKSDSNIQPIATEAGPVVPFVNENNVWVKDPTKGPLPPGKAGRRVKGKIIDPVTDDEPTNLVATNISETGATITWTDRTADETGFTITLVPGNPNDPQPTKMVPANQTNAAVTGGNPNWEYDVTVTAMTPRGPRKSESLRIQLKAEPTTQPDPDPTTKPIIMPEIKVKANAGDKYNEGEIILKPR